MPARGKGRSHSQPKPALQSKPAGPPTPAADSRPLSPLDDAEALWYVRPPAGGQYGPASGEVMRSWIEEHRITPSTLVWRQGWSQWRSAHEALPGLIPLPTPERTEAQPAAAPTASEAPAVTEPVILFGQAGIGQERSVRSQRRRTMIILLASLSVLLLGVLAYIAMR